MDSGRWLPHVCVLLAVGLTALAGVASSDSFTLLLLAVSAVLIMVGGPLAALLAVLAALPFWMMQIGVGGWIWSPLELALVACAGVTALSAGRDVLRTRRFRALSSWMPPADLTFLAGALAMVAVVSLAWVAEPSLRSDSIRSLRRTILEPMVVIPAASYAMRRGWQRPVCLWIVIPGLAVSVLAVVQFLLDRSTVDIGGFARPMGTFTHPNNLAFYLERVIWFVPVGV
ncbi:MAG: hypothetical protein M3Y37_02885, partial [Chloroflexota bacterium]|nr:hypothetical protein [Chloroflexota bacterium]